MKKHTTTCARFFRQKRSNVRCHHRPTCGVHLRMNYESDDLSMTHKNAELPSRESV